MALIDIVVFIAGFLSCWYGKDTIVKWWQGAATFASNLEAKAAALRAAVGATAAAAPATPPALAPNSTPPAAT